MAQIPRKNVRKLVTFPLEVWERVERYRETSASPSESDAIKSLVENGLKLMDTPRDLIKRFQKATAGGQSIADIISILASDHPLVESTFMNADELCIYLKHPLDEPLQRFHYSRGRKVWTWEKHSGSSFGEDQFDEIPIDEPEPATRPMQRGAVTKGGDLDDEIPF